MRARDFVRAAARGDLCAVRAAIETDRVDVDVNNGDALANAVAHGHGKVVEFLLGQGAQANREACRPLACAVRAGHEDIARLLLSHGARVEPFHHEVVRLAAKDNLWDLVVDFVRASMTPPPASLVEHAAFAGHVGALAALIEAVGDTGGPLDMDQLAGLAVSSGKVEPLAWLVETYGLACGALCGGTLLGKACLGGFLELVEWLLAREDVDVTADKHGAMRAASQNGKTEVVKLLMAKKPSQEAIQFGICGALGEGHVETARAIVELADEIVLADVEVANAVAAFAAGAGMADLLQLAIDQGARAGENGSAVLLDAVEKGQTDIVKFVLALPAEHGVDVAASSEFAVQRAAELGHAEILRLLIAHGADPFVLEGKPARLASTRNRSETFRLLLDLPGWSPEMLDGVVGEALSVAAEDGLVDIWKMAMGTQCPVTKDDELLTNLLQLASKGYHGELVRHMFDTLDDFVDDPSNAGVLVNAADAGDEHMVRSLLAARPGLGMEPAFNYQEPLRAAVTKGHLCVVKLLLADDRIVPALGHEPTAEEMHYVRMANDMADMVKTKRVPVPVPAKASAALVLAARYGHVDIMRELLSCSRVDARADNDLPMAMAAMFNHVDAGKLLVEHGAPAGVEGQRPLLLAAQNGSTEFFEWLVQQPGVDPAFDDNDPLQRAVIRSNVDIVDILLTLDPPRGVDPASKNNEAVKTAAEGGHSEVIRSLVRCDAARGVDLRADDDAPLRLAIENGHFNTAVLLLSAIGDPELLPRAKQLAQETENAAIWQQVFDGV